MSYRRSTNNSFNIELGKRLAERKPPQTNIERSEANIDAWLADLEAKKASGEQSDFVKACNKNLADYSEPHSWLWWKWTFIRNRVYRIGVDFIKPIRYIDWVQLFKHIFRRRY